MSIISLVNQLDAWFMCESESFLCQPFMNLIRIGLFFGVAYGGFRLMQSPKVTETVWKEPVALILGITTIVLLVSTRDLLASVLLSVGNGLFLYLVLYTICAGLAHFVPEKTFTMEVFQEFVKKSGGTILMAICALCAIYGLFQDPFFVLYSE